MNTSPGVLLREPALAEYQAVRQLGAGPLSAKWLVRKPDSAVNAVLRVDRSLTQAAGLDRAAEWRLLGYVASAGFAPRPVLHGAGWLLTEYVPGTAWTRDKSASTGRLRQLARHLRALHGLPPESFVHPLDLAAKLKRYAARIDKSWATTVAAEGGALWHELQRGCRPAICHNDLVVGNILDTGSGVALIDWEFAALCYAPFDLAAVAEEQQLTGAGVAALLEAYGEPEAPWLQRFDDWRALYSRTARLWSEFLASAA